MKEYNLHFADFRKYPMGMMAASSYVSMVNAHYEEFGNPTEEQTNS
jgi:hypothetical protein